MFNPRASAILLGNTFLLCGTPEACITYEELRRITYQKKLSVKQLRNLDTELRRLGLVSVPLDDRLYLTAIESIKPATPIDIDNEISRTMDQQLTSATMQLMEQQVLAKFT